VVPGPYEKRLIMEHTNRLQSPMGDHGERSHKLQVVLGGSRDAVFPGAASSFGSDGEHYRDLGERVVALMEQRKPFLEKSFSIRDLAEMLDVPRYLLYRCFKYFLKTRFIDLRTEYRVEHAKRRLLEADIGLTTLEAIGMVCGFATRSSFYRVFSVETGSSPGSYMKRNRQPVNLVANRASGHGRGVSSGLTV
jgi:AraC-like DNA-binding protein